MRVPAVWGRIIFVGACASFAGIAHGGTVVVTTTADGIAGSLRTAIQNAVSGDTIVFQIPTSDPGYNASNHYYTITLTGATAANKTLVIDKNLTIDGGSGQPVIVRRANNAPSDFRVFNVNSGVTATLNRIWISNGNLTTALGTGFEKYGAGIRSTGSLTIRDCIFTGNAGEGGGALNAQGPTTIIRSTFSGNSASGVGAAIYTGGVVFVTIDTCTFTLNAAAEGGAIYNNHGVYTLRSCTVSDNTATSGAGTHGGGGIVSIGTSSQGNNGTMHFENTIVAGNSAPLAPDVWGTIESEGHNLIGSADSNFGFTGTGDQVGVTAAQLNLKTFDYYGAFIPTMPPKTGSFAIDKGKQTTDANGQPSTTDQRGQPRPIDRNESNAPGGDGNDIGAVEVGAPQLGPTFTVTTTAETNDGSCTVDDCTLIEALNVANAIADANTINFAPGVAGIIKTNTLTPTGLAIINPVTIIGPGARDLIIDAAGGGRAFRVTSSNVQISGIAIVNGLVTNDNGGSIHNTGGLTLTDCTISNGASAANGGGVYNATGATLTLVRCNLATNGCAQAGGSVYNDGAVTATNCTFSASSASQGGGIYSSFNNNTTKVSLRNCTITGCTANSVGTTTGDGGGGLHVVGNSGQYNLGNCIVAGNFSSANPPTNPDLRGNFTSDGHNLIGNVGFSTGLTNNTKGDQVGTPGQTINPKLDTLKNNEGPTNTHALLSDSTARNNGDDALAPPTDQRGFARVGISDIGAFEFGAAPPATPTPTPAPSPTPTSTPAPATALANISTRLRVETGDNVLIGGFIITGVQGKKVMIRGIGPSLSQFFPGTLADPTLELRDSAGTLLDSNDNWISSPNKQAIMDTGIAPSNDLESAIIATLAANGSGYTAIVSGSGGATGIGVVEAYDLDRFVDSKLANISTRGFVSTGDNVLIAGTIVLGSSTQKVIIRAIGPSLPFAGKLENPTLELRDGNGGVIEANDNWVDSPSKQAIMDILPPSNDKESAIVQTLVPASYTAIVRGVNDTTGIAVVEVYALD